MDNMTIGASLAVGGNTVQMRKDGKIQVTNSNGKIKTLTQDEFKKNVVKNADKIKNGEDFEFKKDYSKSLKIATAAVGTAIATTGIIYRKEIGKYLKNFSFKKLWQDIKGLFKTRFDKNAPAGYPKQERHARLNDLKETFRNYDADARFNARTEFLKKNNVSEEQFSLMQRILHVNAVNESKMGPIEGAKFPYNPEKFPSGFVINPIEQKSFLSNLQKEKEALESLRSTLPENLRTNEQISKFVEDVRSEMLDGPMKVYKHAEFAPHKDNQALVRKQKNYMSDKNVEKRKQIQAEMIKKHGSMEKVREKIAAKKEAIAAKNGK